MTLGDFRTLLQENPHGEKLAQRLARWVGTGSFSNMFDGKNQLDTGNWLTVFDLTAIKENKLVCCPVMFGVIFSVIAQLAARYPHDLKFVVFDECADFLRDPLVAAYIETCYRQMRKFGVSVVGISQGLEEWLSTSSKTAFVNNTTHLVVLRQDVGQAADLIRDTFNLSEHEHDIITRLQSIPGAFSQALLWQKLGEGKTISSVIIKRPNPLGYAMGTTNPRDKAAFGSSAIGGFPTRMPSANLRRRIRGAFRGEKEYGQTMNTETFSAAYGGVSPVRLGWRSASRTPAGLRQPCVTNISWSNAGGRALSVAWVRSFPAAVVLIGLMAGCASSPVGQPTAYPTTGQAVVLAGETAGGAFIGNSMNKKIGGPVGAVVGLGAGLLTNKFVTDNERQAYAEGMKKVRARRVAYVSNNTGKRKPLKNAAPAEPPTRKRR